MYSIIVNFLKENKWSVGIIRILEEIDLNVYIIALIRDYGDKNQVYLTAMMETTVLFVTS